MKAKALERIYPVLGATIADINGAAVTGDYFDMSKYERCLVMISTADGSATTGDITPALYQAKDKAGTDAAVLNCLQTGRIYTQLAADDAAYRALTAWTEVTQATADEQFVDDDSGEQTGVLCLEIRAADLADGFSHIRCDIAATSSAKIASLHYIGIDPKHMSDPATMQNPLAT